MAKFGRSLQRMFGFGGQEKPQEYEGFRPYQSLKEIPEGQLWSDKLTERLAGKNVGFSREVMDRNTAPFAQARMAGVTNYEAPAISAAASARGLGRSTIPVNRIALSTQEASRDIEQRIADIEMKNEAQKRQEINQALQDIGTFTGQESNQRTIRSGFDYGEFNRINNARAARDQEDIAGAGRTMQLLATAVGGAVGGPAGAMIGSQIGGSVFGSGGTAGADSGSLTQALQLLQTKSPGTVNVDTTSTMIPRNSWKLSNPYA